MKAKAHICFSMLAAVYYSGYAQQYSATATLDTGHIAIGEHAQLKLEVRLPAQDTVLWPEIGDTITGELEVVERTKIDTAFDRDDITTKILSQQLIITSFDSGYWALPPFLFIVGSDTLKTEPQLIEVQTVEVDTSQAIFDIKEPLSVEFSIIDWLKQHWKWLAGGLALAGIAAALIYYLTRKKEKPAEVVIPKPKIPAHIVAMEKLEKLKQKKLWQSGRTKQYHVELSEIVREYIELRFGVYALEQTTYEILLNMRSADIQANCFEKLKQTLILSDLVKFAKEQPVATENELTFTNAVDFVKETIPREPVIENEKTEETTSDV